MKTEDDTPYLKIDESGKEACIVLPSGAETMYFESKAQGYLFIVGLREKGSISKEEQNALHVKVLKSSLPVANPESNVKFKFIISLSPNSQKELDQQILNGISGGLDQALQDLELFEVHDFGDLTEPEHPEFRLSEASTEQAGIITIPGVGISSPFLTQEQGIRCLASCVKGDFVSEDELISLADQINDSTLPKR